jgi:hypothetical protein
MDLFLKVHKLYHTSVYAMAHSGKLETLLLVMQRWFPKFKGSPTRDFRLQVFFINQCPPGL